MPENVKGIAVIARIILGFMMARINIRLNQLHIPPI